MFNCGKYDNWSATLKRTSKLDKYSNIDTVSFKTLYTIMNKKYRKDTETNRRMRKKYDQLTNGIVRNIDELIANSKGSQFYYCKYIDYNHHYPQDFIYIMILYPNGTYERIHNYYNVRTFGIWEKNGVNIDLYSVYEFNDFYTDIIHYESPQLTQYEIPIPSSDGSIYFKYPYRISFEKVPWDKKIGLSDYNGFPIHKIAPDSIEYYLKKVELTIKKSCNFIKTLQIQW